MVRRKTGLLIFVILCAMALALYHREQLVGYSLYYKWRWLHRGEVNFDGIRIVLPDRWWVFSMESNELVCMRLPPGGRDFITISVAQGKPIHLQGGLPISAPSLEIDKQFLERVDPIETSTLGGETVYLITYNVTVPVKESNRVYLFWVIPSKQFMFSTSSILPSQKNYCWELVGAVVHAFSNK